MATVLTQVFNFLGLATYVASPTASPSGTNIPLLCDNIGRLVISPTGATAGVSGGTLWYSNPTIAAIAGIQVKASSASLYRFIATNEAPGRRLLQFFNTSSIPANGAIPLLQYSLQTSETFMSPSLDRPLPFAIGLYAALSTTSGQLTLDSANLFLSVEYI